MRRDSLRETAKSVRKFSASDEYRTIPRIGGSNRSGNARVITTTNVGSESAVWLGGVGQIGVGMRSASPRRTSGESGVGGFMKWRDQPRLKNM